jgi:hypothetical protein
MDDPVNLQVGDQLIVLHYDYEMPGRVHSVVPNFATCDSLP